VTVPETFAARLAEEHRALDELFGRFLGALSAGEARAAAEAIAAFDDTLRLHTKTEEEQVYSAIESPKLAPPPAENEDHRRFRLFRLEHVQIRELSGMIRRVVTTAQDLVSARRLAGSLARRWDEHTAREEKEVYGPPHPIPLPPGEGT